MSAARASSMPSNARMSRRLVGDSPSSPANGRSVSHFAKKYRGLVARWIGPGPHFYGFWVTAAIGIAGSVLATFGGQALGLYRIGQPAGFIGSVVGAIVLLVLVRLFSH